MKKLIIGIFALLVLTGCDAVDDMKGMFEKQEIAQSKIKEKYGWESQLGFNMHNGVLTQVTIVLNANDVRNESVAKLEEITKDVVASTFKSTPSAIYIQIASIADEK